MKERKSAVDLRFVYGRKRTVNLSQKFSETCATANLKYGEKKLEANTIGEGKRGKKKLNCRKGAHGRKNWAGVGGKGNANSAAQEELEERL